MIYEENQIKKKTQKIDIEILTKRLIEIEKVLKKKKNDNDEFKQEVYF